MAFLVGHGEGRDLGLLGYKYESPERRDSMACNDGIWNVAVWRDQRQLIWLVIWNKQEKDASGSSGLEETAGYICC